MEALVSSNWDASGATRLGAFGLEAYGRVAHALSFHTQGLVYREETGRKQFSHQFDPDYGETYSVEKGAGDSLLSDRTYNRYTYSALLDLPSDILIKAGYERLHVGPGYFTSLVAARQTAPYYFVEARIPFADWLTVDDYLLRMVDGEHAILKYANLHRFDFHITDRFNFGFTGIVIYQDRDPDWRYALPLIPLAFEEQNNGGLDNSAMALDAQWNAFRGFSLWSQLFIDDLLSPTSFFEDFWENRWAFMAGFQVVSPWKGCDADWVVEYTHVEPWTYIGRSPQTSFKHFNVPSASPLGPDSRTLSTQVGWRPLAWLEVSGQYSFSQKGQGRQATLGVIHTDSLDGVTKEFLGNGSITQNRFEGGLRLLGWDRVMVDLGVAYGAGEARWQGGFKGAW